MSEKVDRKNTITSRKLILPILIIINSTLLLASQSLNTNSTLKKNLQKKPSVSNNLYQWNFGDANRKTEAELIGMVKAVDILIQDKAVGRERFDLMMSQITNYLGLAKLYRVKNPPTPKDKKNEQTSLQRVVSISNQVLKASEVNNKVKARSYYFQGVALVYLNKIDEASNSFRYSLKLDPKSENVSLMAMFIAENSFEKENYNQALIDYRAFFKNFNKDQRVLAIYKMAWCLYNLKEYNKAEDLMATLVLSKDNENYRKDSLQDLSMFVTRAKNENELIDFSTVKFFSSKKIQYDFLFSVYNLLRSQFSENKYPLIFGELVRLESSPDKKLSLLVKKLHYDQRQYASRKPIEAFKEVTTFIEVSSIQSDSDAFKASSDALEEELNYLVKIYFDTFNKKIQTPENLSKPEIENVIKNLIAFEFKFFPNSKNKKFSHTVLLNLCKESKDYECIYKLTKKIVADESLKDLHKAADINTLLALDNLYPKNTQYKDEYIERSEIFLKTNPNDKDWLRLAKKLTAIFNDEKKFSKSIPYLDQIYRKERNTENLYRYVWALYENGEYSKIIKDGLPTVSDKFVNDIQKIHRECYLKLAQLALEKKDYPQYEAHLKSFLRSKPDESASDIVRMDLFKNYLQTGGYDRIFIEYQQLDPKKWMSPKFKEVSERLISNFILLGQFNELLDFLTKGTTFGQSDEIDAYWLTALIGSQKPLSSIHQKKIGTLKNSLNDYFVNILTITQPNFAREYLKKNPSQSIKNDHSLYILSLRLEQGRWDIDLDSTSRKYLGKDLPKEVIDKEETPVERKIGKIKFPLPSASSIEIEKETPKIAKKVQDLRLEIVEEVKKRTWLAQTRILRKAISLENQTAHLILSAQTPAELKEQSKIDEYKKQVETIAKDFSSQVEEYQKILDKLIEERNLDSKGLIISNLDKLPKLPPQHEGILTHLLSDSKFSGAILFLDKLKSEDLITDELYYSARSKIILSQHNNEYSMSYVVSEIKTAKMDQLLNIFSEKEKL